MLTPSPLQSIPQYHSNYSTMLLAVLREHIELHLHSGVLLEQMSISVEELNDVFNATKKLSIDQLMSILYKLNFDHLIPLSLYSCRFLQSNGFYFQNGSISPENDDLLKLSSKFFSNQEKIYWLNSTNQYIPMGNNYGFPSFIYYCINSQYRTDFDNNEYIKKIAN
ncbi:MAG: hypothetical protein Q4A60_03490 [Pasteurellaceae bacterium]|nr:hypothetical protein [Pasteurellaceae bacterium]